MILHVIDNLLPEKGGPTSVVIELARHQALAGLRVTVACRQAPRTPESRAALERAWKGTGIELAEVGGSAARVRRSLADLLRRTSPRITHLHCTWERIIRLAAHESRAAGVNCVLSTHGMFHPYALSQKRWKKEIYLAAFRRFFAGVREYLVLNQEEADYVRSRFGWPATVLNNGVELERYGGTDDREFRAALPAIGDRKYLLFVGRLHPIKGCDLLLNSFRIARDRGLAMDLVLLGPDEGAMTALREQAAGLGLAGCTHLPGGVFGSVKLSALAGCSAFVHRPRFEGFGIAVIEGMASSRPVVTTARCHLDGAAAAGALLCVEDSDRAFADGLMALQSDPRRAHDLGLAGRRWAEQHCSWRSIVVSAEEAYRRAGAPGS